MLGVAAVVVAIDQFTKWWAFHTLAGQTPMQVIGTLLQFTFVRNPGGAFSLGTSHTWVFTVVATAVSIGVVWYARRVTSGWWLLALGLLLGGAVGNLADRLFQPPGVGRGYVVDFIMIPNFPVWNVADMAVTGAAILIVLLSLLGVPATATSDAAEPAGAGEPAAS